jgi:hypothetical protein
MKTAEEIGRGILERLAAQTARNRASADALRTEVLAIWRPGMTAKQVIDRMSRAPLPSVRRVQEVIRQIRPVSADTRY